MLRLVAVRGPAVPPVEVTRAGAVIGRGSACEVHLVDATMSRRHAEVKHVGGRWLLSDLGGPNGTWLNDVRIEQTQPMPLAPGDRIGVGPWVLQVGTWTPTTVAMTGGPEVIEDAAEVKRIDPAATGKLAHHRLQLIIDCAGRINDAGTERELAQSLLESVVVGTGYGRAALVRIAGDQEAVEVLGTWAREGQEASQFSRSLVIRASAGEMVTLAAQQSNADWGQSIAELEIHSAMCCPILVDDQVAACLYLDARASESAVAPDAAGFCEALGKLAGLAMANLRRRSMQARQRELDEEMAAAREAQQLMIPLKRQAGAGLQYAVEFHPGRVASGDLFDVVQLEHGRIAVILGDVSGKGVGAAILMAAAQAYLHAALARHASPADAVEDLNNFVLARSASNRFLTLWVGVFAADGSLTYVDAGHGYWVHVRSDGVEMHHAATSPVVGAIEGIEFQANVVQLGESDRIVLMTDGVPEQPDAAGEQFGLANIESVLARTRTVDEDVVELLAAVRGWSGGDALADDTTVASVLAWAGPSP
jgi:serine phosphatase RsbU (regulator of sigma subunit)